MNDYLALIEKLRFAAMDFMGDEQQRKGAEHNSHHASQSGADY